MSSVILQGEANTPFTFVRDAEVDDQEQAASLVSQVVADPPRRAPLACAGRDGEQRADLVSSLGLSAKERAKQVDHPVVRLGCTSACACVVAVKVYALFFAAAFRSEEL